MGNLQTCYADPYRTNERVTMNDALIKVEGVSKRFCRNLKRSLWYGMKDLGRELLGKRHGCNGQLRQDEFWAVKDVSFELNRGECLGLIGQNGAGKTTLLRMLNGLIKPDHGRIVLRGRVGALIALGAGFNPILTGRENIHVNASVLGLSKKEIKEKQEEIIDFAEIGEFIDAPVQNYSSGMQVRLGFAVTTALNPDIMLLDEVLAVGDAAFRAKCYHRLSSMLGKCAVILVSHNMDHIGQICSKSMVMQSGRNVCEGSTRDCIKYYNELNESCISKSSSNIYLTKGVTLNHVSISEYVDYGGSVTIDISINVNRYINKLDIKLTLFSMDDQVVAESYTKNENISAEVSDRMIHVTALSGPYFLKGGIYIASIVLLDRSNNEHIFWGSHAYPIRANGPSLCNANNVVPIRYLCPSLSERDP